MKSYYVIFVLILIFFFLSSKILLLKDPPIWPDEAVYADIANNLLKESRLGTDLWKGLIKEIEYHAYFYPPLFFYSIAGWFMMFDKTIIAQRVLSVIIGASFIVCFYVFSRQFFKKKHILYPFISTVGMLLDFTFSRATRVSRPEIFVLFFGTISLLPIYYLYTNKKLSATIENLAYVLIGLSSAIAVLYHTIGFFFPLTTFIYLIYLRLLYKSKFIKMKAFYLYIVSFLIPILLWLINLGKDFNILKEQWILAVARKNIEQSWLLFTFQSGSLQLKMLFLIYLTTTVFFIFFSIIKKQRKYFLLSVLLFLGWATSIYGKMFWYSVFPIPFVYLSLGVLLQEIKKKYRFLIALIICIVVFLNFNIYLSLIESSKDNKNSYTLFIDNILRIIPENKVVFLSTIPDPYFGFKTKNRKNKLYEFPVLATKKENYMRVLNDSDFIVYTNSFDSILFGNFLEEYIHRNKKNIYTIGEPFQYYGTIIELKENKQRT